MTEPTPPAPPAASGPPAVPPDGDKTVVVKPPSALSRFGKGVYGAVVVVGEPLVRFIEHTGVVGKFFAQILFWLPRRPFRWSQLFRHMRDVGFGSVFIVALSGLFTGLSFGFQSLQGLRRFGAEALVGPTTLLALARELGPVLTGLMVAGNSGSRIATELGTMRVTEQIDAMSTLAVEPMQYLVVPRALAATLIMPLLVAIFCACGLYGSYLITVVGEGVDAGVFWHETWLAADPDDFYEGWIKAAFFGLQISTIASFYGFFANGGARGVGEAATRAVVIASVTILIGDYALAEILDPLIHSYLKFDAFPK